MQPTSSEARESHLLAVVRVVPLQLQLWQMEPERDHKTKQVAQSRQQTRWRQVNDLSCFICLSAAGILADGCEGGGCCCSALWM